MISHGRAEKRAGYIYTQLIENESVDPKELGPDKLDTIINLSHWIQIISFILGIVFFSIFYLINFS